MTYNPVSVQVPAFPRAPRARPGLLPTQKTSRPCYQPFLPRAVRGMKYRGKLATRPDVTIGIRGQNENEWVFHNNFTSNTYVHNRGICSNGCASTNPGAARPTANGYARAGTNGKPCEPLPGAPGPVPANAVQSAGTRAGLGLPPCDGSPGEFHFTQRASSAWCLATRHTAATNGRGCQCFDSCRVQHCRNIAVGHGNVGDSRGKHIQ